MRSKSNMKFITKTQADAGQTVFNDPKSLINKNKIQCGSGDDLYKLTIS